jgi:hypothetical protein
MRRALAVVCWSFTLLSAQLPAQNPVIPAADIDRTMKMFNSALGVECAFCHVENDWKNTSKPQWTTARDMWRMVQLLNSDQLANTAGVRCVTCHGGQNKPSRLPVESWQAIAEHWPQTAADSLKTTMSVYSASLGVGCEHCHDPSDWKSAAKPAFATTLRMVAMFDVFPKFMPPTARTQCYMCHKGNKKPGQ